MLSSAVRNKKILSGVHWGIKRRSYGDTPVTCMFIIIALLGGSIWAYFHFVHNRPLEIAGTEITLAKKDADTDVNSYRLRVRDKLVPVMSRLHRETRKTLSPIYNNKVTNVEDKLDELDKMENEMREHADTVNNVIVPKRFVNAQKNIGLCTHYDWLALVKARQSLKARDDAQAKQYIKESKSELAKANKAHDVACSAAKDMFR